MPTNKVNFVTNKSKEFAFCDPRDRSTYIYQNEQDYYQGYQEACMGVTMKKGGWDCMRHYEILANGCLPYVLNIDECPRLTMTSFPKDLCKKLSECLKHDNGFNVYEQFADKFKQHLLQHNTTQKLAEYFIEKLKQHS